jgi:guanine nucleotide-exchange factor
MAGAAGGFVTRAFEAMLKECAASRGKFAALQQSIQSYLGASTPSHPSRIVIP